MAITKNAGRQEVIASLTRVTLGTNNDVAVQGTYPLVDLPEGAVVVGGNVVTTDATTALATAAITGYTAATANLATLGDLEAVVPTGIPTTAATTLDLVIAGADPVLAGELLVNIQYIVDGRAAFSQG